MKLKKILIINLLFFLFLLIYIGIYVPLYARGTESIVDFGGGYYYLRNSPEAIMYGKYTILLLKCAFYESYSYDDNYILFSGIKHENKDPLYVIIDKNKNISFEYEDKKLFFKAIEEMSITLKMKNFELND